MWYQTNEPIKIEYTMMYYLVIIYTIDVNALRQNYKCMLTLSWYRTRLLIQSLGQSLWWPVLKKSDHVDPLSHFLSNFLNFSIMSLDFHACLYDVVLPPPPPPIYAPFLLFSKVFPLPSLPVFCSLVAYFLQCLKEFVYLIHFLPSLFFAPCLFHMCGKLIYRRYCVLYQVGN